MKNSLVAVVVPNWDYVKSHGPAPASNSEADLIRNETLKKAIMDDLATVGKQNGLKPYEMVKDIILFGEKFGVENDLATPTFKLKRTQLLEHFQEKIDELYAKMGEGESNQSKIN